VLLLRVGGGVHAGVHWAREGEVRWALDLWAVFGGSERREGERENHDYNRRSSETSHEVLPTVQVIYSSRQHQRGFHPRRQTDSVPNFGFSEERPFQLSTTWEISKLLLNHARNAGGPEGMITPLILHQQ